MATWHKELPTTQGYYWRSELLPNVDNGRWAWREPSLVMFYPWSSIWVPSIVSNDDERHGRYKTTGHYYTGDCANPVRWAFVEAPPAPEEDF
jgi:hypothetical protein